MFICQYCNSERKNKNSLAQHEIRCKSNPERIEPSYGMLGKKGNNQWGKAKENGEEYILSDETRKKMSVASTGRKHSDETKKNLSKIRKQFLTENPEMVPYKLNHYSNGPSYAEVYWKGILDSHKVDYIEQHPVSLYSLDFAILESKIDLEIDGDQHYLDKRVIESDKRRTKYLSDRGWTVIRIKWSDYQKLDRKEKEEYIKNIIEKLVR